MSGAELLPIVVKPASETAKPLREAVGGTLAEVWQGILGDRVTAWRIKNAADLSKRLTEKVKASGQIINLDKIPERYAYSWFQKATEEDEPEIQELFATLLANAAAGNHDALDRRNIDILSKLRPIDAQLISILYDILRKKEMKYSGRIPVRMKLSKLEYALKIEHKFSDPLALECLAGLNIIDFQDVAGVDSMGILGLATIRDKGGISAYDVERMVGSNRYAQLTEIGRSLMSALFGSET